MLQSASLSDIKAARPLAGRVALVTGGARRIGRTIAMALARAGADVALTYRDSEREAHATAADLAGLGVRSLAVPCDVRSERSVAAAVAGLVETFGRLDILINNAGSFESVALADISVEQWDAMFETNTRGPFLMARAALPALKLAHGRIVNIGSLGGLRAWAGHGHYCASKAALHMLTQTMAKAWAPEISVNCVAPGMIAFGADPELDRFAAKTPLQRNGAAEDVAAAVLFFAAGPAFITGQVLAVDGGLAL